MADVAVRITPGVVISPSIAETSVSSIATDGVVVSASVSETNVSATVQATKVTPTATNGSTVNVVVTGQPTVTEVGIGGSTVVAGDVAITDAGAYYTGTEVETALQEIGAGTTLDGRYLQIANDLSDLNSAITARANIGLAGTTGKVAMWTGANTLGTAEIIPPQDTLTIEVSEPMIFAMEFPENATLTFTGLDNRGVTIPATGTMALLEVANVFTVGQKIDGSADEVQLTVQGNATQTANISENQLSDTTIVSGVDARGVLFSDAGIDADSVYIGKSSGRAAATGIVNVGIGRGTLDALTSGSGNMCVGAYAGSGINTGADNMLIGYLTGFALTTGSNNLAIGRNAMTATNVASGNNVALGSNSGYGCTSRNIFVGFYAGRYQTGSDVLILDSRNRSTLAAELTDGIIVGTMAATPAAQTLRLNAAVIATESLTVGKGAAGVDYVLTFDGETNDGIITWMEDEDAFVFSDIVQVGDGTNYTEIDAAGDVVFVGTAGLPFGHCYGNEIAWTQASAVQNTWYDISDSDMISGELHQFTHDGNGQLTALVAGKYTAVMNGAFEASGTGVHVQLTFSVNGTERPVFNHFETVAATRQMPCGVNDILDLAANDTVNVSIRTTDAGTPDLSADHLMFKLVQVGGT